MNLSYQVCLDATQSFKWSSESEWLDSKLYGWIYSCEMGYFCLPLLLQTLNLMQSALDGVRVLQKPLGEEALHCIIVASPSLHPMLGSPSLSGVGYFRPQGCRQRKRQACPHLTVIFYLWCSGCNPWSFRNDKLQNKTTTSKSPKKFTLKIFWKAFLSPNKILGKEEKK